MTGRKAGQGPLSGVGGAARPPSKPGLNKYRARRTTYDGVSYSSQAEAQRAMELDLLLKAGEIVDWIAQPKFRLGVPENVYVADFLIVWDRDHEMFAGVGVSVTVEDCKGMETPKFRRDKVLWKRYGRLPLVIRKGGKEVERIEPDAR